MTRTSNFPVVGEPDLTAGYQGVVCDVRAPGAEVWRCTRPAEHPDDRCLAGDGDTIRASWSRKAATPDQRADERARAGLHELLTIAQVAVLLNRAERTIRWWVVEGTLVPDAYVGRTPVFFRHRIGG